jgi:pimeloyl-ACP methyl ester carboxylesterase
MRRFPLLTLQVIGLVLAEGQAEAQHSGAVEIVASHVFGLTTPLGAGEMPFDVSLDWNQPQPQVTRAVVTFHGEGRDVDGYYRATLRAAEQAGGDASASSILVAPQFLNEEDARAHRLPASVLRWRQGTWEGGVDASGPSSVSAFEVIDAIAAHLSDRRLFPNLRVIVLAGHSGGGQAVQRYAIVGRVERVADARIHIRYVVANPSSYLYFSDDRPRFEKGSYRFEAASGHGCQNFNHWKYGPVDVQQDYVRKSAASGWQTLEDAYAQKDVLYLLRTDDVDPPRKRLGCELRRQDGGAKPLFARTGVLRLVGKTARFRVEPADVVRARCGALWR